MAPLRSHLFLSFLLLISSASSSRILHPRMASDSAETQAQKLIRSFNLFPQHDMNRGSPLAQDPSSAGAALVEKPLKLPVLGGDAGNSIQDLGHHAGYYRIPNTVDERMFYFFFESRRRDRSAPVVIWLTGGPGCSSELALFYENGPFHIANNLSLVWNEYGWDQASNLIYVDQPTGTGFSYSSSQADICHDEGCVSNDLYNFLQGFFKHHPEYVKNDFYITGESYAGHYVPAFASRVQKGNQAKEGIHINLKGIAIGNGLTDPAFQYRAYPDYALEMKLITQNDSDYIISNMVPQCEQAITLCSNTNGSEDACAAGFYPCTNIFDQILSIAGNINYYDVRKQCNGSLCYDFSNMETLLNKQNVRDALGVGNIEFVSCSSTVYDAMVGDWMRNLEVDIPALLEAGIKVLIYAGEDDLICNWLGNSRWVHAMAWSGQKGFNAASSVPLLVDGVAKGLMTNHGPLTFVKVFDAGHLVPMDQPKASLQMLRRWTRGKLTK